jgi:cobalt-zinc-cadmium efflux system protein
MAAHQHDHHQGEHDHGEHQHAKHQHGEHRHAKHAHDHGHSHGHDHGHSHAPKDFGFIFAIVTALNIALVVLQVAFGVMANSVALLADAGHNFGDALALLLAWGAHVMCKATPTRRYTYGFRSASILAALANGVILLVATGAIAWEAIHRFSEADEVAGATVMIVAGLGIVINGVSAWLLLAGQAGDLNIRGAFLHLVGDALVSVGVVVAGGLILLTGWHWIDPAASLVISAVIIWSTWGLLRHAVNLSLAAVPHGINPDAVRAYLEGLPGVKCIHDLHIWAMSTTETALTVHLVMPTGQAGDAFLLQLSQELHHRFEIDHPTVQVETDGDGCKLAPDHVI